MTIPNLIKYFYLSTPLFFLLDVIFRYSIRFPYLDTVPTVKYTYYAITTACGLLIWFSRMPAWLVGFLESIFNLTIMIVAIFMSYMSIDQWIGGGPTANPFTVRAVIALALSGTCLLVSIYTNPIFKVAKELEERPEKFDFT